MLEAANLDDYTNLNAFCPNNVNIYQHLVYELS